MIKVPTLNNCGMYLAKSNDGKWFYLNHVQTWQQFQGPQLDARHIEQMVKAHDEDAK